MTACWNIYFNYDSNNDVHDAKNRNRKRWERKTWTSYSPIHRIVNECQASTSHQSVSLRWIIFRLMFTIKQITRFFSSSHSMPIRMSMEIFFGWAYRIWRYKIDVLTFYVLCVGSDLNRNRIMSGWRVYSHNNQFIIYILGLGRSVWFDGVVNSLKMLYQTHEKIQIWRR